MSKIHLIFYITLAISVNCYNFETQDSLDSSQNENFLKNDNKNYYNLINDSENEKVFKANDEKSYKIKKSYNRD